MKPKDLTIPSIKILNIQQASFLPSFIFFFKRFDAFKIDQAIYQIKTLKSFFYLFNEGDQTSLNTLLLSQMYVVPLSYNKLGPGGDPRN